MLWSNGVHFLVSLFYGDDKFMAMKIMLAAYFFECAASASIWYHICETDKLPNILSMWHKRCQCSLQSKEFGTSIDVQYLQKNILTCCAFAVAFIASNTTFIVAGRLLPFESLHNDTTALLGLLPKESIGWLFLTSTMFTFANGAFSLPVAFIVIITSSIACQFKMLTKIFTDTMTDEGELKACLKSVRRQHQYLSKVVFLLDDALNFYLAVTIGSSVILTCFGMYQLVVAKSLISTVSITMIGFWVLLVSAKFGIIGIFTSRLHKQVRRSRIKPRR